MAVKKRPVHFGLNMAGLHENINRTIDWIDETVQTLDSRKLDNISQLSDSSTTAQIIEKINELIQKLEKSGMVKD